MSDAQNKYCFLLIQAVSLPPNQALELGPLALDLSGDKVLAARLLIDGAVAARAALWPEPFKYLDLYDPGLEIARLGDSLRGHGRGDGTDTGAGKKFSAIHG